MKKSLLLITLVAIVSLGAVFLMPDTPVRIALVYSTEPGVAERDNSMLSALQRYIELKTDETGHRFAVTLIDINSPPEVLESSVAAYAEAADSMLMVGCADSVCVRRLLPELEKHDLLLLYPGSSEGLFRTRNVLHLGVVANQFLFPAVSWIRQNLGQEILYIGSESARSRLMERLISRQLLTSSGDALVSAEYLATLEQLPAIADRVSSYRPDVVLFDACEWLPRAEVQQALGNMGTKIFSLCTDAHIDAANLYYISHYYDHPHNKENTSLRDQLGMPLNGLIVQGTVAIDFYLDGWTAGRAGGAHEFADYINGRNALTAAGSMAIDFDFQGVWHSVFIVRSIGDREHLLWMSDALIRPVMFPGLEAPSDWQHHLTIYWRNNGGYWRQGTIGGEKWL